MNNCIRFLGLTKLKIRALYFPRTSSLILPGRHPSSSQSNPAKEPWGQVYATEVLSPSFTISKRSVAWAIFSPSFLPLLFLYRLLPWWSAISLSLYCTFCFLSEDKIIMNYQSLWKDMSCICCSQVSNLCLMTKEMLVYKAMFLHSVFELKYVPTYVTLSISLDLK